MLKRFIYGLDGKRFLRWPGYRLGDKCFLALCLKANVRCRVNFEQYFPRWQQLRLLETGAIANEEIKQNRSGAGQRANDKQDNTESNRNFHRQTNSLLFVRHYEKKLFQVA